jgi:hypothetical protein
MCNIEFCQLKDLLFYYDQLCRNENFEKVSITFLLKKLLFAQPQPLCLLIIYKAHEFKLISVHVVFGVRWFHEGLYTCISAIYYFVLANCMSPTKPVPFEVIPQQPPRINI